MISENLDDLVNYLADTLQLRVTRNPATVAAPCVFVDAPAVSAVRMGSMTLDVPVWLIAPGQADLVSLEWLNKNLIAFVRACKVAEADPRPYRDTMPAYRATIQLTIKE